MMETSTKTPKLEDKDDVSSPRAHKPLNTCLILSASFMFVYTAYLAIQNLQSSLNDEANLGVSSLCVLYGTIIFFGPQAPLAIRLLGPKRVLVLAWSIHCLYTISNFYPTWATLIPSSALLGAIAGPMWTAQGIYITAAGEKQAALTAVRLHIQNFEKHVHAVLSRFNGIFFMFYELTQISGNLISSLVLSKSTFNSSETSLRDLSVCGPDDCPFISSSSNTTTASIEKPETGVIYIMLSIFLGFNVCGLTLTVCFLPTQPNDWPPKRLQSPRTMSSPFVEEFAQCLKTVGHVNMLLLLPLFAAQAMAIGVLYADYTKSYVSCVIGIKWVGYVMTSYGICTAIFAVSINSFASRVGRITLFTTAIFVDTGSLVTMLVWDPEGNENYALYFLVPAFSGISEGIMQAQFNTLIGQAFSDNIPPAFAAYHTCKATSFTLTFALSNFVCLRERLYLAIALYAVGLLGYLTLETRLRKTRVLHSDVNDVDKARLSVLNESKTDHA